MNKPPAAACSILALVSTRSPPGVHPYPGNLLKPPPGVSTDFESRMAARPIPARAHASPHNTNVMRYFLFDIAVKTDDSLFFVRF